MPSRLRVCVQGTVQGVGYRFGTYARAQSLGLSGWVRNLPDCSVEAEFEGPRQTLAAMLEWCKQGPATACVTRIDETWSEGDPKYTEFKIQF